MPESKWYLDDLRPGEPPDPRFHGTVYASSATTLEIKMDDGRFIKSTAVPNTGNGTPCNALYPSGKLIALRCMENGN
jgi:hypothetical protein